MSTSLDLVLEKLVDEQGVIPALIPPLGEMMVQACAICFDNQGHSSGVEMEVIGDYSITCKVHWQSVVSERMRRSWEDKRATELAACGIAILLIYELTQFTPIEISRIGTGFDYWLGSKDDVETFPFQEYKARLEVSGIRKGTDSDIERRVKVKVKQTKTSDHLNLPAYVVVVEFSKPQTKMVIR
ncbi:MAG: hypothetical protein ACPGWR_29225 [Ardenticatenaceae bacterium]